MLVFQSTLPAKGAIGYPGDTKKFSLISIHAPRKGSDLPPSNTVVSDPVFQSTLPAKGAMVYINGYKQFAGISIHAPRKGSD